MTILDALQAEYEMRSAGPFIDEYGGVSTLIQGSSKLRGFDLVARIERAKMMAAHYNEAAQNMARLIEDRLDDTWKTKP